MKHYTSAVLKTAAIVSAFLLADAIKTDAGFFRVLVFELLSLAFFGLDGIYLEYVNKKP